jgi:hypothetical protein
MLVDAIQEGAGSKNSSNSRMQNKGEQVMTKQSYTKSFALDQSPEEVFKAINNVRGWWSEEITGRTDKLGGKFKYHFRDVHSCTIEIVEFVPGKRVAWRVLDNRFSFTKEKFEWKGTTITFDIDKKGNKTAVRFTHIGLVPDYECFDVCSEGWNTYINGSLRSLITTGKGRPNIGEAMTDGERTRSEGDVGYTTTFTVDQSPDEVFKAINNVRAWWSGDLEGDTNKLGAVFTYRFKEFHRSTHKITEFVPGKKVVWHTTDASINFVKDKTEWNGTDIVFDIATKGDKTELRFSHIGLVPAIECYGGCSGAWGSYINESLRDLITEGKGQRSRAA